MRTARLAALLVGGLVVLVFCSLTAYALVIAAVYMWHVLLMLIS